MQPPTLVSAIIPTYNRAGMVRPAIESILAQTYAPVEVIVVDDGSTDDTPKVLERYGKSIRVIRQANAGPSAARNTGVRNSHGELIAFLDSDDVWLGNRLEAQVKALITAGRSVPCCFCNVSLDKGSAEISTSFKDAGLRPLQQRGVWLNPFEVFATRFVFFNQAAVIWREAFERVNGFDERLRFLEDYDLALRLALLGPWAFVAEPLVVWKQSADSLSREARAKAMLVKTSELEIRRRFLSNQESAAHTRRGRLMHKEARRNERELVAARLAQKGSSSARALARGLEALERSKRALFRRSPRYPTMRTESFERWEESLANRRRQPALVGEL